jgi:hypothetical protein
MTCKHTSTKRAIPGQTDDCIQDSCRLPIIFNGTKWVWTFSIGRTERRILANKFHFERLTGAKS